MHEPARVFLASRQRGGRNPTLAFVYVNNDDLIPVIAPGQQRLVAGYRDEAGGSSRSRSTASASTITVDYADA